MDNKIQRLKAQIAGDEEKLAALQEKIKQEKIKLREMENSVILNNINLLHGQGICVTEIIDAIKKKDQQALLKYLDNTVGMVTKSKGNDTHE